MVMVEAKVMGKTSLSAESMNVKHMNNESGQSLAVDLVVV